MFLQLRVLLVAVSLTGVSSGFQAKGKVERIVDEFPQRYWISEDVGSIICAEETKAYARLSTDLERAQFIDAFWRLRDPTPDTPVNELATEHYRRIIFANQNFSDDRRGAFTDRGRVYVLHGPPDGIQRTDAAEVWRYRFIEGVGEHVRVEFAGPTRSISPSSPSRAALLSPPCPDRRYSGHGPNTASSQARDLEALLDSQIGSTPRLLYGQLPFELGIEVTPATRTTSQVSLRMVIPKRLPSADNGRERPLGDLRCLVRVRALTGRIVQIWEGVSVEYPSNNNPHNPRERLLRADFPLFRGRYRLEIVLKDSDSGLSSARLKGIRVGSSLEPD
jgi:GWxTD domain-containing protein